MEVVIRFIFLFLTLMLAKPVRAQELPPTLVQQLEDAFAMNEESDDDSYVQTLQHYKKNPINLNAADISELKELHFLFEL